MNKQDIEKELQKAELICRDTFAAFEAYRIAAMNKLEKDVEYQSLLKAYQSAEDEVERLEKIVRGLR